MSNKTYEEHKFKELLNHVGHHIECVTYGNEETGVVNIAIECQTCHEILFDIDKPKTIEKQAILRTNCTVLTVHVVSGQKQSVKT